MNYSPGLAQYKLSYQISPIIMTGGIATFIPGGMLPSISLSQALNFVSGLLSGPDNIGLDDFFANYQPLPGGTLLDLDVAKYPFANQQVAANAIIVKPLTVSMLMIVPVQEAGGYWTKLAIMTSLQSAFYQHALAGGLYTVATPSFFYTNCILTQWRDVTGNQTKQVQSAWQLDFEQPLVTQSQAAQAQNFLMGQLSSGVQTDGSQTGLQQTIGQPAQPGPTIGTVPASTGFAGSGVATPFLSDTSSGLSSFNP